MKAVKAVKAMKDTKSVTETKPPTTITADFKSDIDDGEPPDDEDDYSSDEAGVGHVLGFI